MPVPPPSQPPLPPEEVSKPPLPPEIIPPPPPVKPPESQVEDMDLSDEEETEPIPIETSKENQDNNAGGRVDLSDALSSFYSDLATIAEGDSASQDATDATLSQDATPTPPKIDSPGPSSVCENSPNVSDNERSNSPFNVGESMEERRKRKVIMIFTEYL